MYLLALSLAPAIIILLYIYLKDKYNKEPLKHLITCFILGVLVAIPIVIIELIGGDWLDSTMGKGLWHTMISAFIVVAFSEEYGKYLILRFYAFPKKTFDEPLDGIVYSVFVSMGFASIENVGYVFEHGASVGFLRMFVSVPAHASFAVLMGYYVGLAKFNHESSGRLRMKGLLLAVLFHGAFDLFLFLNDNNAVADYVSNGLLVLGALVSYIVAVRLSLKAIKKHELLSKETHDRINMNLEV